MPAPPIKRSSPEPPTSVSLPAPPSRTFAALFPDSVSAEALPSRFSMNFKVSSPDPTVFCCADVERLTVTPDSERS
ncbi:hypothetical protein D3C76_1131090 [compost metagenome]